MFMNILIIFIAKYLFIASIAIFLLYLAYLWKIQKALCISIIKLSIISLPLTLLSAKIFSHFIYDPRPFVVEHVKPLIPHVADNGFPSDHMLLTMALASVIYVYNRKLGIILAIIAILVGTARVFAKVHHIEDIIGSAVIAIGVVGIVYFLGKRFFARFLS